MTLGIQLNEIKHVLLADRWHEVEPESFALDDYEFMDGQQAGGGFGTKGPVYPEEIVVAALARRLGRPVRWTDTRQESFVSTTHAGEFEGNLRKGRLAAISGKMVKQSPESMKIRTPSAIMGVRGTEFVVQVDEDKK